MVVASRSLCSAPSPWWGASSARAARLSRRCRTRAAPASRSTSRPTQRRSPSPAGRRQSSGPRHPSLTSSTADRASCLLLVDTVRADTASLPMAGTLATVVTLDTSRAVATLDTSSLRMAATPSRVTRSRATLATSSKASTRSRDTSSRPPASTSSRGMSSSSSLLRLLPLPAAAHGKSSRTRRGAPTTTTPKLVSASGRSLPRCSEAVCPECCLAHDAVLVSR
mmetsp:Transcript_35144/g.88118  ORF Transcript_35144/g.88118 Transcript_35144/m.88118 type:complete len:224 (-) Transcript_35144:221-892(-)